MTFRDGLDNPGFDPADDKFDRWPFSKRLADTIATFDTGNGAPVFGIFGRWGYGKSTVLNYIRGELEKTHADKVVLFEFNPWLFTSQDELLAHFFVGLAAMLDQTLGSRAEDAGQFLKKWSGAFGLIPGVGGGMSKLAEQVGAQLTDNSLMAQRKQVFEIMRNAKRTVVVLIDDLDRLDQDEILTMLKLIRLNANFPHIVYVIAFDEEMVVRSVGVKYGGGPEIGRQFLEKIVQYAYALPAIGHERLVAFVLRQAEQASDSAEVEIDSKDWARLRELMDLHFSRRLNTPRQAIRYANALAFALPMLKADVNPFEQMLIEGLRVLFPELYALIRDHVRSFSYADEATGSFRLLDEARLMKYATSAMRGSPEDDVKAGAEIVKELFNNPYRRNSIVRPRFFDRYFTYAVAQGDISDDELFNTAARAAHDVELSAVLNKLGHGKGERLIDAIYAFQHRLPPAQALVLAVALGRIGELFVSDSDLLLREVALGPRETNSSVPRLEQLIWTLFRRSDIKEGEAANALARVVEAAEPPLLAIRFAEVLAAYSGREVRGARILQSAIAGRISALAKSDPAAIFHRHGMPPDSRLHLLTIWHRADTSGQRTWLDGHLVAVTSDVVPALEYIAAHSPGEGPLNVLPFMSEEVLCDVVMAFFGQRLTEAETSAPSKGLALARRFVKHRPGV
jgi:KAP family P-loop domain